MHRHSPLLAALSQPINPVQAAPELQQQHQQTPTMPLQRLGTAAAVLTCAAAAALATPPMPAYADLVQVCVDGWVGVWVAWRVCKRCQALDEPVHAHAHVF